MVSHLARMELRIIIFHDDQYYHAHYTLLSAQELIIEAGTHDMGMQGVIVDFANSSPVGNLIQFLFRL